MARKKIHIDPDLCIGCGSCAANYPDDIRMNDDGIAEVITGECDEEVVDICPVGAISTID
ncbi:MAG: ferredoxin [Bacilli bacterium]|jgi:ferredoxin|nr:ferredoxin [Bacilli bacterium]